MDSVYLRQGGWCRCERSYNMAEDKFENGISVFECEEIEDGRWWGKGRAFEKRERAASALGQTVDGDGSKTWYLVKGDDLGCIGGDDEPLLKNVMALKTIALDTDNCFIEEADFNAAAHENHPEYPDCKCETMDEFLARNG